ncbi:hypothetical protein CVT25_011838 [Psilocybe cyanescens]|uniref:Nephrocystin 3-like N-terminal domain-containing protein n=1 Tax=Psilocybe cyanescens TaxID=93625 RepID=A0A409WJ13_PSICY|nr:hypothetical protein CVT25_011838 [Psilocybe cyanescens]
MLAFNQAAFIAGGSFTQINHNVESAGFKLLQQSVADGAFHNSSERFDPPKCYEKTRIAVLQRILDWVFRKDKDTRDAFIMWLYGPAGAGKSAIMQTIAEQLDTSHHLVVSFFFARNHPTRGHADWLIATIAYQLALILPPEFRQNLVRAVEHDPLMFSKTIDVQFAELIAKPLEHLIMSGFSTNYPYLIIIDGLDECKNTQIQSKIIDLAFKIHHTAQHLPLLFLVASRPELEISSSFELRYSSPVLCRLALDDGYRPNEDIRCYLDAEFEQVKKTHRFRSTIPENWPPPDAVNIVVEKSSGQFIYAATVVKYVTSIRSRPTDCLEKILGLRPLGKDTPFAELDSLYTHILSGVEDLETVLLAISIVALQPSEFHDVVHFFDNARATWHIETLLSLEYGSAHILFQDLKSLISITGRSYSEHVEDIHILHSSFLDFLFDKSRCLTVLKGGTIAVITRMWPSPEVVQFTQDQMNAFESYIMTHLSEYFSNPDLFFILIMNVAPAYLTRVLTPSKSSHNHSRISLSHTATRMDNERLVMDRDWPIFDDNDAQLIYRRAIFQFLSDPERAGQYTLTGTKYAESAYYALILAAGREPHKIFHGKIFLNTVPYTLWTSEFGKNHIAARLVQTATLALPYLLEKSGRSEQLIDLGRKATFGTNVDFAPEYSREVRAARKAIKKYLGRMEG